MLLTQILESVSTAYIGHMFSSLYAYMYGANGCCQFHAIEKYGKHAFVLKFDGNEIPIRFLNAVL
jgi:hypothetical protein